MIKKILVTGGLGFMGSDFIRLMLDTQPEIEIVNLDKETYAANRANLKDYDQKSNYQLVVGDIAEAEAVDRAAQALDNQIDAIINFAAETHVDRSIADPTAFLATAVQGTYQLLELAKRLKVRRYIQISTDEIFGEIESGGFTEESPVQPRSPYSAAKAAGDLLAMSYANTYELPVIVTHCCNNYGPFQYPEKLIPLALTNLIEGKSVPVYGDGLQTREWIFVRDHSLAIQFLLTHGQTGEVYNIGSGVEKTNRELLSQLLEFTNLPASRLVTVQDRPGHDRRYAIDSHKLRSLGWQPQTSFSQGLAETVRFYQERSDWWEPIKQGEYKQYYQKQYRQAA